MTMIRERIENPSIGGVPIALLNEWKAGNLIPADEVEARIREAVTKERERSLLEGYDEGFAASAEGWNGEIGPPYDEPYYLAKRADIIATVIRKGENTNE